MSKKQQEKIRVTKKFDYTLRNCALSFSLTTLLEMKDFRTLMLKGIEDLDKVIAEYEKEEKARK